MESLVTASELSAFYKGKRVLVTGHTGFKGSWLALWLTQMGSDVTGYALPPEETPSSLYTLAKLSGRMRSQYGDIRDYEPLKVFIKKHQPEMIFHMAAQSLVLPSYEQPIDTFATNIMGTVHVLEAARHAGSVRSVVNVTTDKCYENNETATLFKETDPLGGHDPYSASKAATEIVSSAYRRSFLALAGIQMATARAGNVIGGGDFSRHRLIPDIIKAALKKETVNLRQPDSVRPWQYVLDVLRGYLMLGKLLYEEGETFATAFNFGPDETGITVGEIADALAKYMKPAPVITRNKAPIQHEAVHLNLDNSQAKAMLGWHPLLSTKAAIKETALWYGEYLNHQNAMADYSLSQLSNYAKETA